MSIYWYCAHCKMGNASGNGFCGSCGATRPAFFDRISKELLLVAAVMFVVGGTCGGFFTVALLGSATQEHRALNFKSNASPIPTVSPSATAAAVLPPSPAPSTAPQKRTPGAEASATESLGQTTVPESSYRNPVPSAPRESSERDYMTGPRGGCYYFNSSGNKTYVDRSLCRAAVSRPAPLTSSSQSSNGYTRGPRGGCYYINSRGNKTYVDRSVCN